MHISSKNSNFEFYETTIENLADLATFFDENKCDLVQERSGFGGGLFEGALFDEEDQLLGTVFKEIVSREVEALEDGKVQSKKFWYVEEAQLVIAKNFIVALGKTVAINSAVHLIQRFTKREIKPLFIAPERLLKLSDNMAFIRTVDFDRMDHPTVKKLHFDGKIESFSDIAPFHSYTANMKSVKGVMSTPFGPKTIKIVNSGKVKISKKKEEEIDANIFKWIYKFLKGKAQ